MRGLQTLRIGAGIAAILCALVQGCASSSVHRGHAMNVAEGEVGVAACSLKQRGAMGEIEYVLVNRGGEQREVQLHVLDMAAMQATLVTKDGAVPVFEQVSPDEEVKPDLFSKVIVRPGGSVTCATRGLRGGELAREAVEAISSGEAWRLVADVAGVRAVR